MIEFDFSDCDDSEPTDRPSELELWADVQLSRELHDPAAAANSASVVDIDWDIEGLIDFDIHKQARLTAIAISPGEAERAIERTRVRPGEKYDPFDTRYNVGSRKIAGGMVDDGLSHATSKW